MEKTDGMPRPHPSLPVAPPPGKPPPPPPPHPPQHMASPPPLPPSPPHQPCQREPQPPLPTVLEPSDISSKRSESGTTATSSNRSADSSRKWDTGEEETKGGNEKERGMGSGAKIKMSFGSKGGVLGKRPGGMISMKLKPQSEPDAKKTKLEAAVPIKSSSKLVAKAFGSDSEEEEEMPPEAKLRMRNIGKDTPTSAGPNSFNKTQRGFSDPKAAQAWRQTD